MPPSNTSPTSTCSPNNEVVDLYRLDRLQMDLLNSDVDFGVRTASGHNMNLQLAFTLVGTVTTFAVVIIQIYMSTSPAVPVSAKAATSLMPGTNLALQTTPAAS